VLSDEVQDQTRRLRLGQVVPQAAPELLHEQRGAHGRPQKQERIDERQVDTFVVEVAREDDVDLALTQAPRRILAEVVRRTPVYGEGGQAVLRTRRTSAVRLASCASTSEARRSWPV
jgi:hypothetical protein